MNDIVNIFLVVYNKIKSYDFLGTKETTFANLIGKAPHIGNEAWLHAIYKPVAEKDIVIINENLNFKMPKVYEEFLKVCNGFSIYGNTLSLYGFRYNNIRDLENIWQPFSLVNANIAERPIDAKDNHFFIGSYNWDGSKLFIDTVSQKIYRCSKISAKPLNEWENFEDMLISETNRLSELFDEKGIEINEEFPTIPIRQSSSS